MIKKDVYRAFCQKEPSISLFSQGWWLDAVIGADNWEVALVEKGGVIVATMPYVIKRRSFFLISTQPPLTQTLGPWLQQSNAKYAKALGQQKDRLTALIEQLPKVDYFAQNWNYLQTNWLPFYWSGFKQSTFYTYVIDNLTDHDLIWKGFTEKVRTDIKKSLNRFNLTMVEDPSIDDFIALNRKVFDRQNMKAPYSEQVIRNLDKACCFNTARKIFIAVDEEGRHHAGVYIVWDRNSAYYLMGGGDPELRNSGATSLCLWEAIKFSSQVTKRFDFEGSNNEAIECFIRGFGAKQVQLFSVSKTPSRLLRLRECVQQLIQ